MRQWMVDPRIMCRKHLLGEHVEHHMFVATLNRRRNVFGFLDLNLLEPRSLAKRHRELVAEMKSRGYNHQSPLKKATITYLSREDRNIKIDRAASLKELLRRCPECRRRYRQFYK